MAANNRRKPENKILLQLASVLIAVVLWFIISYTENPIIDVTFSNIKIEYKGLEQLEERGLTIPQTGKNPTLAISVSGSRSDLLSVIRKATAYVDVSEITHPSTYTLDIEIDMPTDSVLITKQKIRTLDVTIDPVITKEVPIVVRQTDKNKSYLVKSTPQQENVKLTGAQSLLDDVSSVMVAVSTINMKTDNMQKYSYRIMDSNNGEIDNKTLFQADTDSIMVYNELYTPKLMEVDIQIPESVSSMYDVEMLQPLTITAGVKDGAPDKLIADFPENAITEPGTDAYEIVVRNTDNVYIEHAGRYYEMRAVVTKKELQYIEIPVRFRNVRADCTAWCETPVIETYINCVPSKLIPSALVAYADMSGLGEGSHEILLTFDKTNDVTIIGEYKVNVTLSKSNS